MNGVEIALAGYLAFGQLIPQGQQEIVKHAGLQVLHADGAVTRKVVIPPGKWLADDDKTYIGPAHITVDAPLGRLPHFAFVP